MTFLLFFLGLINLNSIAMEHFEVKDEIARTYAAEVCFKQETVDPQLLTREPYLPVQDPFVCENIIPCVEEAPLKSWKSSICRFSLSAKKRKKSRTQLTDWFNSALDLLSSSKKQKTLVPIILSFSKKTGQTRYSRSYKPKIKADTHANGIQHAVKVHHNVKKAPKKKSST